MPNNLEGYLRWDIVSFNKFYIAETELVLDHPFQMGVFQKSNAARIDMITGTSVNQSFYLGGDAPIQISPMAFRMSFDFGSKDDMFLINRLMRMSARASQSFFPAYWIEEVFHIPSNSSSTFKISRYFPYNIVSKAAYPPEVYIDGTLLTVLDSGSPATGECTITNDADEDEVVIFDTGTYLTVRYPPLFYLSTVECDNDIPETVGEWILNVTATEHLVNKAYSFSVP